MRIFLDANVPYSAARSDGAVRALLHALLDAGHECLVDPYVVHEARRNLARKGSAAEHVLETLLTRLHMASTGAPGATGEEFDWLPDTDRPVLAAAIRLRCQALVTGDRRHFGRGYGRSFGGVKILSPAMLAREVLLTTPAPGA